VASYASVILAEPSLEAYWKCNDAGPTTVADSAPTPDDGSGVNTPTFGIAGPVAVNTPGDTAISLDRPSLEEISVPDANKIDFTTALTIECWGKPTTNPAASEFRTMFAKLVTTLANGDYDFFYWNNGGTYALGGEIQGGSGFQPGVSLAGPLPTTSWSHLAMTWDGSNTRFYLNGVIVGSPFASSTTMTANTSPATIGRYGTGTGTDYWHGGIGHVALYNTALSAATLLNHYTIGTTPDVTPAIPRRMPLGL
jgi:hypothetical protein